MNNALIEDDKRSQINTNTIPTAFSSVMDPTLLTPSGTSLINSAKSTKTSVKADELHPADLRKFLSEDHIKKTDESTKSGPPIDRGSNGSMIGDDIRIIAKTDQSVDVCGIDNRELSGLRIVTASGVVKRN